MKNKATQITIYLCVVLLALTLIGGSLAGIIINRHKNAVLEGIGGVAVESDESGDVAIEAYAVSLGEYETHNIASGVDSAQILKATVKPDNDATNSAVTWSIAWKNPSSEWATGKQISQYLTLQFGESVTESKTCTVSCLQAFGEPAVITVKAKEYPEITKTVPVDYVQKITDYTLKFGTIACSFGYNTDVTLELGDAGTPTGGTPQLSVFATNVYTKAADYTVTYSLAAASDNAHQVFVEGGGHMSNGVDVGFFHSSASSVNSYDRTNFDFATYNVQEKGLYFGLKFMVENMGFGGDHHFMNSYVACTYAELVSAIIGGMTNRQEETSYDSWTVHKTLFRLTVKLTVNGNTIPLTKWTDFQVTGYKNTVKATGIEVDKEGIVF